MSYTTKDIKDYKVKKKQLLHYLSFNSPISSLSALFTQSLPRLSLLSSSPLPPFIILPSLYPQMFTQGNCWIVVDWKMTGLFFFPTVFLLSHSFYFYLIIIIFYSFVFLFLYGIFYYHSLYPFFLVFNFLVYFLFVDNDVNSIIKIHSIFCLISNINNQHYQDNP